jgi:hypothetical protein
MSNINFKNISKSALYVSSLCGLGYFAVLMFLHTIGYSLSIWIDLIFKFALVICVIWSIMGFRMQYAPRGMPYWKAFGLGMLSSVFLGIYMTLSVFIFQTVVAPDYHKRYKEFYTAKRSNQMYNTLLDKQIKEKDETYKLTAADSALVEKGLNLHLKNVAFHFTAGGSATINLLFSLIWGIAISATVSLLASKK